MQTPSPFVVVTLPDDSRKWEVPRDVYDAGQSDGWIRKQLDAEAAATEKEADTLARTLLGLKEQVAAVRSALETLADFQAEMGGKVEGQAGRLSGLETALAGLDERLPAADYLAQLGAATVATTGAADRARMVLDDVTAGLQQLMVTTEQQVTALEARADVVVSSAEGVEQRLVAANANDVEAVAGQLSQRQNTALQKMWSWLRGLPLPQRWLQPDEKTLQVELVNGESFSAELPAGPEGARGVPGRVVAGGGAGGGASGAGGLTADLQLTPSQEVQVRFVQKGTAISRDLQRSAMVQFRFRASDTNWHAGTLAMAAVPTDVEGAFTIGAQLGSATYDDLAFRVAPGGGGDGEGLRLFVTSAVAGRFEASAMEVNP